MYNVAVLEPATGKVTALLRDKLLELDCDISVLLSRGDRLSAFSGSYDLFLATSSADAFDPSPGLHCDVLLASCDASSEVFSQISSGWVASFGMGTRDSITVSSLEPDFAQLALQRELVTLDGVVLDQQEIPIALPPYTGPSAAMALFGALLLLGVPPEVLVTTKNI